MKVYIYYLTIPEKPYGKFTQRKLSQFLPVQMLYANEYYEKKNGANIEVNGVVRHLYAFTNDKKLAKDFEFLHEMTLFTKFVKKMGKKEYKLFAKDMEHAELSYYSLEDKSTLLLTKMEHHVLDTSIDDIEMHLSDDACLGYDYFKDEYIHALDLILFTLYYQMNGPDAEFYENNWSYGLTPEGSPSDQVNMIVNFTQMYLDVFSLILK